MFTLQCCAMSKVGPDHSLSGLDVSCFDYGSFKKALHKKHRVISAQANINDSDVYSVFWKKGKGERL